MLFYHLLLYIHIGFKVQKPPPLPSNHVHRHNLLDEIATKLLQATIDPNKYETTLAITGAGGFGKTTTVISLCHYPVIKEHFTDGFIYIELGPQATAPSVKLSQLYHLLTGKRLKACNHAEQEIKQLMYDHYPNLLVIIDDVWHVEDAEPLVKAFSNCKMILTTRMNDIEQHLPSKQSVVIGPMEQNEAFSLLTSGIIDSSQLSQEDVSLLNELTQDVHMWPLLLSLIRGHLLHNIQHLPTHTAIKHIQDKLHQKGLMAFDKNTSEKMTKSLNLAVKSCLEMTLELLTKPLSDKIKTLILWTGIGNSIQTALLSNLWNISKQEAEDTIDVLWAYGIVKFTDITISPNSVTQHHVGVNEVISQYIIEHMDGMEVRALSPIFEMNTAKSISKELSQKFPESYGTYEQSSLFEVYFLKCIIRKIEDDALPYFLNCVNMNTVYEPHIAIMVLQGIQRALMYIPYAYTIQSLFFHIEIDLLIAECQKIIANTHIICRKFNQSVQKYLYEKSYDKIIEVTEEFVKNSPLCKVAQKAVIMVKRIIPDLQFFNSNQCHEVMEAYEVLQLCTSKYHEITTLIIPEVKFSIKVHRQIRKLLSGSPDIEVVAFVYDYLSGRSKEGNSIFDSHLNKQREVAPNYVESYLKSKYHLQYFHNNK